MGIEDRLGKAISDAIERNGLARKEGYMLAVQNYRDLARDRRCSEDEADFLVIMSDIVEGKAPS